MGKPTKQGKEDEEVNLEEEINKEEEDASDDDTDKENQDDESIEEEDSDSDEKSGEEEGGESDSEASGETEETDEVDPRDDRIAKLEAEIEAIKGGKKDEGEKPPQKKVFTEDEMRSIEERSGMDFKSVQFVDLMLGNAIKRIQDYVEGQLGGFKKTSAIDKLAKQKGFEDAKKYEAGINEFLENFSPAKHSDERILKMAYTYSKGLGVKDTIKKVVASKDKNKKIVGKARPVGGDTNKKPVGRLSDEEKSAARAAGMSEAEYAEYKKPLHLIGARK